MSFTSRHPAKEEGEAEENKEGHVPANAGDDQDDVFLGVRSSKHQSA